MGSLKLARARTSLALVAAIVAGCAVTPAGVPLGPGDAPPLAVRTAPVATANVAGTVTYAGNVESVDKVSLLPKIAGQIVALNVDVGSAVKKGDVVAELDHATLDAQVAQAQAGVAVARAKLATIQAGSRPETIAQAKANLAATQATLAFLRSGGRPENVATVQGNLEAAAAHLGALERGRPEGVAQAQANLNAAQAKLQSVQNGPRPEVVGQAKASLDAAQAKLQALKLGPTPQQIAVAQQAVEAAKDAAYGADVNKDGACNPGNPTYVCNAAQAAAAAAHTGANAAQAQLNVLTSPPTAEQLRQAQAAVDQAQQAYALAQKPYTAQDLAQAQSAVDAATAQIQTAAHPGSADDVAAAQGAVAAAQAQVDLAKQPASSADLAKAQAAVDVAAQQVQLAQQPFTAQDADAAEAAVDQAQAALQVAQAARDQASVTSPIDGWVTRRLLSVGALAAPTSPIVVLVDPRVNVVVDVDGSQASALHPGDAATITADVRPGTAIPGKVTTIAPSTDPQTRAVQVRVAPDAADSGLNDGMLAQVRLALAHHEGVLVVPTGVIVQRNGQPAVYVVTRGTATPRPVQIGISDGTNTEITAGLHVGEAVVVSGQDRLTTAQPVTIQQ